MALSTFLGLLYVTCAAALGNSVGKLPTLGFNSKSLSPNENMHDINLTKVDSIAWNVYQCDYDSGLLLAQAEAMVHHGLVEAGYDVRQC